MNGLDKFVFGCCVVILVGFVTLLVPAWINIFTYPLIAVGGILGILSMLMTYYKLKKVVVCILLILIMISPLIIISATGTTKYKTVKTVNYDIYSVSAPFGFIWRDVEASGGGNFLGFSAAMNSELQETYIIKYMIGDELHSMTMIADKSVIKIDNQFCLERTETITTKMFNYWNISLSEPDVRVDYRIHLPKLPDLSTNITDKWIIVG